MMHALSHDETAGDVVEPDGLLAGTELASCSRPRARVRSAGRPRGRADVVDRLPIDL